jgi:RNA polymerase sigma-70 factor (ECF subfamily)
MEPISKSLNDLIASVALGNQKAFSKLYSLTAPKLLAVILRILKNKESAEEILQEGFVRVWYHAGSYRASASAPMTWMTTIMRNAALDVVRRKSNEQPLEEDEDFDIFISNGPTPVENALNKSNTAALENCLQQLPATYRQTIVLAFYHGMSHMELATHLTQPIGTIKTWTRRGMERIKGCLESL